jgi:hypothetical protein
MCGCNDNKIQGMKKRAKMRGFTMGGMLAPLALGGGAYFGRKGANMATEKVDFLAKNKGYAAGGKVLVGALGFDMVSKLINSVIPVPMLGEGLMGGIILSGVEDGMEALAAVKGDEDNYDWERLYNQAAKDAGNNDGGRL